IHLTALSAILILSASSLFAGQTPARRAAEGAPQLAALSCPACSNAQTRAESCHGEGKALCAASSEAEVTSCKIVNRRGRTAKGRPAVTVRDQHSPVCMFGPGQSE